MAFTRQNWQTSESGILRKKEENEEELLVFGYSCKLFRDDEKALYVDQGKHLIPWMGDESLRIDRYDVRGALYDLNQYEAISGQQEESFWINLSAEERRIEQLCDEERYRALTHNEDEERLYQEEELKRLHQALGSDKTYGQVSYSYEDENGESEKPASDQPNDDSDEPFVPPPELDLPVDMVVPETVKLNAIIEKTVMFINKQGLQMEIILKMKQATNPQFEFLSYRSPLHPYYRHVLGAVKTGRYKPKAHNPNNANNTADEGNAPTDQHYYLHHTLSQVPASSINVTPVIPTINYKPSADCAYSMLVNKIRNNQNKMGLLSKTSIDVSDLPETTVVKKDDKPPDIVAPPKLYNFQSETSNQSETVDGNSVDNDLETDLKPASPAVVPSQRPNRRKRRKRQQGAFAYNDFDQDSLDGNEFKVKEVATEPEVIEQVESETMDTIEEEYETPPTDLQLIIDKMACYVGKNGRDFEEIVKSKADPRFSFLDSSNQYYVYYRKQVEFYEQSQRPVDNNTNVDAENNTNSNSSERDSNSVDNVDTAKVSQSPNSSSKSSTHKPNPVCFSIKRPKETESLEIKSALPVEESSDDNEENEDGDGCNNDNAESVNNNNNNNSEQHTIIETPSVKSSTNNARHTTAVHEKHEKRTDERVKVISSKEKEKLLQLERKRRAAAFLNSLQKTKKPTQESVQTTVMIGPQLPDELKTGDRSDSPSGNEEDESDSVSSPPSSVTSPEVTFVSETTLKVAASPKNKSSEPPSAHSKPKRSRYSSPEKYAASRHREKDGVEYKHKHRKRKRSRTPTKKHHSHSGRSHFHHAGKESKHRKHHRHHRKEYRHGDREYNDTSSSHRRHKHYKLKKHKRKDDKKYTSKSANSNDSDSG